MDSMGLDEIAERLQELGETLDVQSMSLDEIADHLGFDEKGRLAFKQSVVAAKAPWAEVETGVACQCGEQAKWVQKKRTFSENGLGFDVFPFLCPACNEITERKWRAPSMDGKIFAAYETTYKMKESGDVNGA